MEKLDRAFTAALKRSIKTPFGTTVVSSSDHQADTPVLLTTQPMVLCLDVWSALILGERRFSSPTVASANIPGILYLFFGGVPYVFRNQHDL